jgi:acetoin utilization protein AcuB
MTENPVTVGPDTLLNEALDLMKKVQCHHLPVLSRDGHLIGIVTDHDCQRGLSSHALVKGEREGRIATVKPVMTPAPIVIEPDAPIHEAARLMLTNHIRSLPVMRAETLVGIITSSDLLIALMNLTRHIQTPSQNM